MVPYFCLSSLLQYHFKIQILQKEKNLTEFKILLQDLSLSALAHPFFTTCLQFQDLEIVGKLKYHIERQLENYEKL